MTSNGDCAALTLRTGISTMRMASAVAISFALHAAALAVGGGQPSRSPAPATDPLTVSLSATEVARGEATEPRSADDATAPQSHPLPSGEPLRDDATPSPALGPGPMIREYFPSDALTRLPEAITDFDALFPVNADPPPGRIELRLWLSRDGIIDKLEVLQADAPAALTSVALNAFRQMRFRPGEIRGIPVGSTTDIVVEFAPAGGPPPAVANP